MTETEIIALLDQIAASSELTRRLADVVYSQLNAGVRIDPAMDNEDVLKAI